MTLKQVRKNFKEYNADFIKDNKRDKIKVNFEYSCYLDSLCKNGEITQKQYNNARNYLKR